MQRTQAIVLVLTLLATPLALLARANACGPRPCCRTICNLPQAAPSSQGEDTGAEMACHHHRHRAPAQECAMRSACNHTLDFGFAVPLPPTELLAGNGALAPPATRSNFSTLPANLSSGFDATPFEPPRS